MAMKLNNFKLGSFNNLKLVPSKKEAKVVDPPRYPEIINGYEGQMKKSYTEHLSVMLKGVGDEMVKIVSNK